MRKWKYKKLDITVLLFLTAGLIVSIKQGLRYLIVLISTIMMGWIAGAYQESKTLTLTEKEFEELEKDKDYEEKTQGIKYFRVEDEEDE